MAGRSGGRTVAGYVFKDRLREQTHERPELADGVLARSVQWLSSRVETLEAKVSCYQKQR